MSATYGSAHVRSAFVVFWSAFIQPGAFLHGSIKTVVINLAVKLMSITVLTFIDACNDSDIGQSDFHR